jgi:large subunit ribosomal protein L25
MSSANYLTSRVLRRKLPLVDRFLFRESRTQEVVSQGSKPINPEPFKPHKSPTTGRWIPPRLSLRRQAQLGKVAYKEGKFEELSKFIQQTGRLESVKLGKMKDRMEELAIGPKQVEDLLEATATTLSSSDSPSTVAKKRTKMEEERRALRLAKALAATRGPYAGRSLARIFKGTIAERHAAPRKQATREKLSTMDKSVEAWRKVGIVDVEEGFRVLADLPFSASFPNSLEQRQGTRFDHQCHTRMTAL